MPKCFVVMGFGKKTDFSQNKTFDLDKSYPPEPWMIASTEKQLVELAKLLP
jgi:hypothetical protein